MTFCDCSKTNIEVKIPKGDTHRRHVCKKCGHIFYENPKIVTGIIPIHNEKILLCKRAIEPRKNYWTVPSGFMEMDETLQEAALREANEEAGIKPKITALHTIYDLPHLGQVYFLFKGKCETPNHTPGIETIESKWFEYKNIPWSDIAFSSVTFGLKHFFNAEVPHYGKYDKNN